MEPQEGLVHSSQGSAILQIACCSQRGHKSQDSGPVLLVMARETLFLDHSAPTPAPNALVFQKLSPDCRLCYSRSLWPSILPTSLLHVLLPHP